ncbi:DNA-binding protein [Pseudomonas sp. B26(2017)]|uniref:DNA-binding protein n=1 Tax=Pseudomonas sp. B26(2017) TaxID=1981732 RepID=UPI000A1D5ED2|nr:DNA-binding protein [Pseudomonas sp. B26(2017)]
MARGGINKALVQKARSALLTRGLNPSIDAVRVELGNTGSKTTISRYLQELEAADPRPQSDPTRLSDELTGFVAQLMKRLLEESNVVLAEERTSHEQRVAVLNKQIEGLEDELKKAQQETASRDAALVSQAEELKTSQSSLQTELNRNARISQSCSDLEVRIQEKDELVRSLEEKHAHARDALEHYRTAIKEQREQDQRRHETQLQQSQHELLQLQQTLMVRQDEQSRLIRDNERLLGEARQNNKLLHQTQDSLRRLEGDLGIANMAAARAEGAKEMLQEHLLLARREAEAANAHVIQLQATTAELTQQLAEAKRSIPPSESTETGGERESEAGIDAQPS